MAGGILDRVREEFERECDGELPEDVLEKCVELCMKYRVDPVDLCDTWTAYAVTNNENSVPSVNALNTMERKTRFQKNANFNKSFEQNDLNSSSLETDEPLPPTVIDLDISDQVKPKEFERNTNFTTPKAKFANVPSKEYESRKNSGHVVCSFGNNSDSTAWSAVEKLSPLVEFSDEFNPMDLEIRYMFCTLLDKIQSFKKQGDVLCEDIIEKNNLKPAVETHHITMETATFAGRILCDGRGKLNVSSLLLESCLFNIREDKVKLEVNDAPEYCLFPGQVIVVEGKNPDGKRIVAEKIYTDAKPQMYPDFDSVKYSKEPLQIVIASGPFMLSNGSFQPLLDLKQYANENQPHVLILIGPFVDAHNPNILQFCEDQNFHKVYEQCITEIMTEFDKKHTQVIVISSWKEGTLHTVYPTPPVRKPTKTEKSKTTEYENLKIVPDPSILDISGFHLGITSSDILLHLSPEELCHPNTSQNMPRLCRIASHLLKQKSFYPLKPSHDDMSIDAKLLVDHAAIPKKPHVLVLPSNLKSFINVADDCVIINPERIAKGEYGGTFARIQVKSVADGEKWSPATHISAQVVKI